MARRPVAPELVRARIGVGVLFVVNAATYANVVPRLPQIKAELGLSNTALGAAIAALPIGALLSGLAAGGLIARFGSARVAAACGLGFGLVVPLFSLAPAWSALAAAFLGLGLLDSLMDVSMNAHALRVQRGYGRSIVNAMHGVWSLGAVVGGVAGALAAGAELRLEVHLALVGVVVAAGALVARGWLLPGPDDLERGDAVVAAAASSVSHPDPLPVPPAAEPAAEGRGGAGDGPAGTRARLAVLGLVVVLAGVLEDAPASWGAVLLRTELGASAAVGGLVFIAFQVGMTAGRFGGDPVVDRLGPVTVARGGGVLVVAGVVAGLAAGEPWAVVAGFGLAGVGAAPLFPLVFHAAGNLPGVSTGHGVAVTAWMSRLGFLTVPPLVGVVADATSLRAALALVPIAGVCVVALAGALDADG